VFGQPVTWVASVSSGSSGAGTPTGTVSFTIDGVAQPSVSLTNGQAILTSAALAVGSHTVAAVYNGDSRFDPSTSAPLSQTVNKANTSIVFSASATHSVFGQTVTFTALIAPVAPGAGSPSGNVIFSIDGVAQLPSPVNGGQATFSTSHLQPGNHEVAMTYSGDGNFNSSVLDPSFTVVKADTATTITASSASSALGQSVTFSAVVGVVAPGSGTPTGSVNFMIDGSALPAVPLSNGQATFTTSALGVGSHTITAAYSGDSDFNASTSASLNYTVNQGQTATTTVIHSSAARSVFGHSVRFIAIISPTTPGGSTPTGTVTFSVDGETEATVTLVNGMASFRSSDLAVGRHVIIATYNGDTNFMGSQSSPFTLTVVRHGHRKHHHGQREEDQRDKDKDRDDARFQHLGSRSVISGLELAGILALFAGKKARP
jgi:hypothetical protein